MNQIGTRIKLSRALNSCMQSNDDNNRSDVEDPTVHYILRAKAVADKIRTAVAPLLK